MEPLDTLMALADKFAHARWKDGYTSAESAELYNELSVAITLALAAERRRALMAAIAACKEAYHKLTIGGLYDIDPASECIAAIRALIDGKAGGT